MWARTRKDKETATFEFDRSWLERADRFSLEPALTLDPGPFLAQDGAAKIPHLIELPRLLSAAERVLDDTDDEEDLRLLLAPGSSLGGTRPKASIRARDGSLAMAKFPHRDDEIDRVRWETLANHLAVKAGLPVADSRLEIVADKPVLLLKRFDRHGTGRIPFLSAMSMLGADERESRSYLEIADAIRQHGRAPKEDLRELDLETALGLG